MSTKMFCSNCGKDGADGKLFPTPNGGWMCGECGFKYALTLVEWLRLETKPGLLLVSLSEAQGNREERELRVFEKTGVPELVLLFGRDVLQGTAGMSFPRSVVDRMEGALLSSRVEIRERENLERLDRRREGVK